MKKNLLLFFLFAVSTGFGQNIFVDQSVTVNGDGTSWATAFQDIQSAINAANANDTIFIAEGVYQPQAEIDVNVPLNFRGGYPAGGGVQDPTANITQIQADFDPSSLLFNVFEVLPNSPVTFEGLRFFNVENAVQVWSDISFDQVEVEQASRAGINISADINSMDITNSLFTNNNGYAIISNSSNVENVTLQNTIFDNGTEGVFSFSSSNTSNFEMSDCVLRNYDTDTYPMIIRMNRILVTNFLVENNNLTGGATILGGQQNGSFTVRDSDFINNTGSSTLGIQTTIGSLILENTNFINNIADGSGSGILNIGRSSISASNCRFIDNSASSTGTTNAIRVRNSEAETTVVFENCEFRNNEVFANGNAGTIDITGDAVATTINNCVFDGNNAIYRAIGPRGLVITNNTFRNNTPANGLFTFSGDATTNAQFENNRFFDNTISRIRVFNLASLNARNNSYLGEVLLEFDGVAIANFVNDYFRGNTVRNEFLSLGEVITNLENILMISEKAASNHTVIQSGNNTGINIVNSTFSAVDITNTNVAIDFDSALPSTIQNSIIWSGSANLTQSGLAGNISNLTIDHSLIKGENPAGTANLDGTDAANNPEFVNPTNFDFRMQDCSPTINVGLNTSISETLDFNGNPRIFDTTVDLGAYESQVPVSPSCTPVTAPSCVALIGPGPINNNTDVAVDTDLFWAADMNAIGYVLQVGTTSGGTDLVNETLGPVTTYNLLNDLPENDEIFVTITPFNGAGNATSCSAESFTTESMAIPTPNCVNLISPAAGATDVETDLTEIRWDADPNATNYRITINGSTSDVNDVTDLVVTSTNYTFTNEFIGGETVTVTIIPFNTTNSATGCTTESFTITGAASTVPDCTNLTSPLADATDVAIDTNLEWSPVTEATGYRITVVNTSTNTIIVDNADVNTNTSYDFASDLDESTTYAVTITPYNDVGDAMGCIEESFTTMAAIVTDPNCVNLTFPVDGSTGVEQDLDEIRWSSGPNATQYRLTIDGDSSNINDITDLLVNENFYRFTNAFNDGETVTVTITPLNGALEPTTACPSESFTIVGASTIPDCTNLTSPPADATDVAVDTNLEWSAIADATGYRITVFNTNTAITIVDNEDVNANTSYDFTSDLDAGTIYEVTITPYNDVGDAMNCSSEQFTTEMVNTSTVPGCTQLAMPENQDIDVAITTNLEWNEVLDATGYQVFVGTSAGANDIVDADEVISTSYDFTNELAEGTTYFVRIIPFNDAGSAIGCVEVSFTTILTEEVNEEFLPDIRFGLSPDGDGINEFWNIDGIEQYPNNTVEIYNRWNDLVFQINNYDNSRNVFRGTANKATSLGASDLPEGTYFFNIIVNEDGVSQTKTGFVVLKR